MCERLDIKSSKDAIKLKAAKDEVYLKGFYGGVMIVGECAGMKVILIYLSQSFLYDDFIYRYAMRNPLFARSS